MLKDKNVSVEALQHLLADQTILMMKVRNYHWNIEGTPNFVAIHRYLDEIYAKLAEDMDETAERVRIIGGKISVSVLEFANKSHLKEDPSTNVPANTMLENLVSDFKSLNEEIYKFKERFEENNDMISSALMDGYLESYATFAWFLRSSIA